MTAVTEFESVPPYDSPRLASAVTARALRRKLILNVRVAMQDRGAPLKLFSTALTSTVGGQIGINSREAPGRPLEFRETVTSERERELRRGWISCSSGAHAVSESKSSSFESRWR